MTQPDLNNVYLILIHNQEHFKQKTKEYKKQRDELLKQQDVSFHDEIHKQYKEVCKWVIVKEICEATGKSNEEVLIVVEQLNMDEYL